MKCARAECGAEFILTQAHRRYCCNVCQRKVWQDTVNPIEKLRYRKLRLAGYGWGDAMRGRKSQQRFEEMMNELR